MIFDDKEKCLCLANEVLRRYIVTLGKNCSLRLLQLSENITYLVENKDRKEARAGERITGKSTQPKAVLRLCRPGYHTVRELRAEMAWMEELGERFSELPGVRLRQPIRTDAGDYLCEVEEGPGQVYYGAVFTYLPGAPLEEIPCKQQIPWFEKLGEVTALLHLQAKEHDYTGQSNGRGELPRFCWDYESMIGRKARWGDWRKVLRRGESALSGMDGGEISGSWRNILKQADRLILRRIQNYGMTAENYGLIHGDLRGANLLVEKDMLGIIDFDDCGYGWYMQDLAASLSFMETNEAVEELIRAWCRGYRRQGTLERADIAMIDTFIMMRRLQLLSWIDTRDRAESAMRYRNRFLEGTVLLADKYLRTRG